MFLLTVNGITDSVSTVFFGYSVVADIVWFAGLHSDLDEPLQMGSV